MSAIRPTVFHSHCSLGKSLYDSNQYIWQAKLTVFFTTQYSAEQVKQAASSSVVIHIVDDAVSLLLVF